MSGYFDRLAQRTGILPRPRPAAVGKIAAPHIAKGRDDGIEPIAPSSPPEQSATAGIGSVRTTAVDLAEPSVVAIGGSSDASADTLPPVAPATGERDAGMDAMSIATAALLAGNSASEDRGHAVVGNDARGHLPGDIGTPKVEISREPTIELSARRISNGEPADPPQGTELEIVTRDLATRPTPSSRQDASQPVRPARNVQEADLEKRSGPVVDEDSRSGAPHSSRTVIVQQDASQRPAPPETVPQIAPVPDRAISAPTPEAIVRSEEAGPVRVVRPVLPDRSASGNLRPSDTTVHIGKITLEIHSQQPAPPPPRGSSRQARSPRSPEVSLSRFYLRGF